jgi:hypothetical protein
LLHDEVPSGHKRDLESFSRGCYDELYKKNLFQIFHVHNKLDSEKKEKKKNFCNPLDDTLTSLHFILIHKEFVAVIIQNLCINNHQKFLHSKTIEHVRYAMKKAVTNLSIEIR